VEKTALETGQIRHSTNYRVPQTILVSLAVAFNYLLPTILFIFAGIIAGPQWWQCQPP
jgi:hypothetical protein